MSQRMGRPKRNSPRPSSRVASHRIAFGNARSRSVAARTPPSTDCVASPSCRRRQARYSPFGVCTRASAATSTPCLRAKPSAAGVGSPFASKAARTGGPVTVSSRSDCRSPNAATVATSRRGATNVRTGVRWSIRASASRAVSRSANCVSMPGIQLAGISSQPISRSSSEYSTLMRPGLVPTRRARRRWRRPASEPAGCKPLARSRRYCRWRRAG